MAPPEPQLRILLIEDDEDDYILARKQITAAFAGTADLEWARNWDEGVQLVEGANHDVYLVDYYLGERTGLELIRETTLVGELAPFILLTGQDSPDVDAEAMRAGATDYLVKGQYTAPLLKRAIRYAIERKKTKQKLLALAQYDSLTGLANRSLFHQRLQGAIRQAGRTRRSFAILLLDLDHFKDINDTLGHSRGDQLLMAVSKRLSKCIRETDTVARLGGDEFAVIATHLNIPRDCIAVAEKIADALSAPFQLEHHEVYSATSIGITVYPTDGNDPDQLLKNADVALYRAKAKGRSTYQIFDRKLAVEIQTRKTMESELRKAIERDELDLHLQPQIDSVHNRVIGAEALLRWHSPDLGMVPPGQFIPLAESNGLIIPLGDWVLETACKHLQRIDRAALPKISIAVNLSGAQFRHGDIVTTVQRATQRTGTSLTQLELELTESILMRNVRSVLDPVEALHALGVKFTLDDFGTGYCSLAYLKRFPLHRLKIDRSFVRDITTDPNDATLVNAIITLSHNLNLDVIAEGVETAAQMEYLQQHGCPHAQGYYFAPALPWAEFETWYRNWLTRSNEAPPGVADLATELA